MTDLEEQLLYQNNDNLMFKNYKDKLDKTQIMFKTLTSEKETMLTQLSTTIGEINEKNQIVETNNQQIEEQQNEIEHLNNSIKDLRLNEIKSNDSINILKIRIDSLSAEKIKLEFDILELNDKINEMETCFEGLNRKYTNLEKDKKIISIENADYMLRVKESNEQYLKLKNEFNIKEKKLKSLETQNKQLQSKIESIPNEITTKLKSEFKFMYDKKVRLIEDKKNKLVNEIND